MKKPDSESNKAVGLTVPERVLAAISLFEQEAGHRRLSVAAICRAAGVSRASLYVNHRDLVAQISRRAHDSIDRAGCKESERKWRRLSELQMRRRESEARYQALLIVCIEQQAEIASLRVRLAASTKDTRAYRSDKGR